MMQFQIKVKFLNYIKIVGTEQDKVNCLFISKNSYDGKQKFGLHGVAMREKSNEQYADLLRDGKKVKHKELTFDQEKVSRDDVRYTHKHSGINVEQFAVELQALAELYQKTVSGVSNTFQVYSEMSEFKIKTSPNRFMEKIQKRRLFMQAGIVSACIKSIFL